MNWISYVLHTGLDERTLLTNLTGFQAGHAFPLPLRHSARPPRARLLAGKGTRENNPRSNIICISKVSTPSSLLGSNAIGDTDKEIVKLAVSLRGFCWIRLESRRRCRCVEIDTIRFPPPPRGNPSGPGDSTEPHPPRGFAEGTGAGGGGGGRGVLRGDNGVCGTVVGGAVETRTLREYLPLPRWYLLLPRWRGWRWMEILRNIWSGEEVERRQRRRRWGAVAGSRPVSPTTAPFLEAVRRVTAHFSCLICRRFLMLDGDDEQ